MIVLITGASHTGKTILAQRLLEKYKYPYLSIDHLKMGLIRSGNTELTPMDDNELTQYLWPIVREIVKTAIENKQNLIVEGCYIPFDWQNDFDTKHLENIKYFCLVMSEKYIRNHFTEIKKYANVIENRSEENCCTLESVLEDNTEILKLANKYKNEGKKVLLIAGDTFRAGAIEQLIEWGNRTDSKVISSESKDPSSVVYDGLKEAIDESYDVVLIDTAGRLQNKVNLMNELEKMNKVIGKFIPNAPHETLLVIDATTGQNGISQAKSFKEITGKDYELIYMKKSYQGR